MAWKEIMHQDWDEDQLESDFWAFWQELNAYAEQYRLPVSYVEDEFLLEGEFIPVHLNFCEDQEDVSDDA